eukprot:Gb_12197 [translate_table: standard]
MSQRGRGCGPCWPVSPADGTRPPSRSLQIGQRTQDRSRDADADGDRYENAEAEVFHSAEICYQKSMEFLEELSLSKGLLGPLCWKLIAIVMEAHHARFCC